MPCPLYLALVVVAPINWCKYFTSIHGGCHWLHLTLVVHFHSATGTNTPLALELLVLCCVSGGGGGSSGGYII